MCLNNGTQITRIYSGLWKKGNIPNCLSPDLLYR